MQRITRALVGLTLAFLVLANAQKAPPAPAAVPTQAEAPAPKTGPYLGLVLKFAVKAGGDEFLETVFTDGSTQTMYAGQGGTLAVGGEFRPGPESPFAVRGTVGYKFVTTAADNANIELTRIPIELVGTYGFSKDLWAGAGYVRHTAVKFDGDGFTDDVEFKDAQGPTVELGWKLFALTYTKLAYETEAGDSFDASSFGVSVTATFPRR